MKSLKYISLLIVIMLIVVLPLISAVWWNPFTWFDSSDVDKSYDIKTQTVELINKGDSTNIAKVTLDTPPVNYIMRGQDRLVAEFTIESFDNYDDVFSNLEFYNIDAGMKKFNRDFTYKYKTVEKVVKPKYKEVCKDISVTPFFENGTWINSLKSCYEELDGTYVQDIISWNYFNEKETLPKGNITLGIFTDVYPGDNVEWIPTLFDTEIDEFAIWTDAFGLGLDAYYPLEEVSGAVLDSKGRYNLSNTDASPRIDGIIDKGYWFNGGTTNGSHLYATPPTPNSGNGTISLWLKPNVSITPGQYLMGRQESGSQAGEFGMYLATGKINAFIETATGNIRVTSNSNITVGQWVHVAFVWNDTQIMLYINGTLQTDIENKTTSIDSSSDGYYIGAYKRLPSASSSIDGTLDEIGIWNRTLSASEISDLWNSGAGLGYNNTIPVLNITYPITSNNWTWYGQQNVSTLTVGLNWTVYDIGLGLDTCWYQNHTPANTTVTCGNNASFTTTYNTPKMWWVFANDSLNNIGKDNHTIEYGALVNLSEIYNATSYETATEAFMINLSYPSSHFSIAANLSLNGTKYAGIKTGSGDSALFTKIHTFPEIGTPKNQSFYWEVALTNSTDTYWYNYSTRNVSLRNITFGFCDDVPGDTYLNISFKNEETDARINGTIDSAPWDYWIGNGSVKKTYTNTTTVAEYSTTYCFLADNQTLHNDVTMQYKSSPDYPQRAYDFSTDLTNTTTNLGLYLIETTAGIYVTFQIQDNLGVAINGAEVTIERQVGGVGAWTTVGFDTTDDTGAATFFLDPDYDHRLTITKSGYATEIITIRPTQTIYTIILTSITGDAAEYSSQLLGISYDISPSPNVWLIPNTVYTFTFNITASLDNLISYSINITNTSGYEFNSSVGTTSSGGNLSVSFNVGNNKTLWGKYYIDVGNGTYLIDPVVWSIQNVTQGDFSIKSAFEALTNTYTDIDENYTVLIALFFGAFLAMASFTLFTKMELSQPGICLVMIMFFTIIASIAGFFTIDFSPNAFMNQYGIALVASLYAGGFFIGRLRAT